MERQEEPAPRLPLMCLGIDQALKRLASERQIRRAADLGAGRQLCAVPLGGRVLVADAAILDHVQKVRAKREGSQRELLPLWRRELFGAGRGRISILGESQERFRAQLRRSLVSVGVDTKKLLGDRSRVSAVSPSALEMRKGHRD